MLLALPSLMMMMSGPLWGMLADWWQRSVVLQNYFRFVVGCTCICGFQVGFNGNASVFISGRQWYLIDALTIEFTI